jgi:GxxExxY protein
MDAINTLAERIIDCAVEVHRNIGPGLLESAFDSALGLELDVVGLPIHFNAPLLRDGIIRLAL